MLLTSGQVSVAVSSCIVFLCTTALFLSGYVLQQRTLRDLRAAIKQPPRPSPKIFLPDRFKHSTTELADGTIVALDEDGKPLPAELVTGEGEGEGGQAGGQQQRQRQQQVVVEVEVRPTLPDDVKSDKPGGDGGVLPGDEPTKTTVEGKKAKGKGSGGAAAAAAAAGKDGEDEPQKPMSRAERRRRIKEEIQKLAQGERGYFRRLGCGEGGKC